MWTRSRMSKDGARRGPAWGTSEEAWWPLAGIKPVTMDLRCRAGDETSKMGTPHAVEAKQHDVLTSAWLVSSCAPRGGGRSWGALSAMYAFVFSSSFLILLAFFSLSHESAHKPDRPKKSEE
jgi:hypothetical protein